MIKLNFYGFHVTVTGRVNDEASGNTAVGGLNEEVYRATPFVILTSSKYELPPGPGDKVTLVVGVETPPALAVPSNAPLKNRYSVLDDRVYAIWCH
jgi:hypothetical protein